jgi:predicted O-methyltransferase YrrM
MAVNDRLVARVPAVLEAIHRDSRAIGFTMASEPRTGSLIRTLAASKPGGRFLEIGTGTGIGTAWLLDGMDSGSQLDSVDNDPDAVTVARRHLGGDPRATWHVRDGSEFLAQLPQSAFDFIFADAWPGKFSDLDLALSKVRPGGIYLVDDLLPQPNWPDDHAPKVSALVAQLETRAGFLATKLAWASGLMILVRGRSG